MEKKHPFQVNHVSFRGGILPLMNIGGCLFSGGDSPPWAKSNS